MQKHHHKLVLSLVLAALALMNIQVFASSHADAPLISLDPSANTTDVYAFVTQSTNLATYNVTSNITTVTHVGTHFVTNTTVEHFTITNFQQYLTVALSVYPFEEPGNGPNNYKFDGNVTYVINVMNTPANLASGHPNFAYEFQFHTTYRNTHTILQAFTGVITNVGDANQNLQQTYTVTKVDFNQGGFRTLLGTGIVPPNNQGIATPFYNQGNDGNNPAQSGAATTNELDQYTLQSVANLIHGYTAFAGQRDDAFFGDVTAIFDLLSVRNPGLDTQAGFNVHTIVLNIPLQVLNGPQAVAGVYATTTRPSINILHDGAKGPSIDPEGPRVQVARQGNPLFNEVLVAIADKDLYSRTSPSADAALFAKYALNPEPAALINAILFPNAPLTDIETGRTDLEAIFIPDVIKVDLSTGPARLAGGGSLPNDDGFSRLGLFGNDTLVSTVQTNNGGVVSGGWPNGRRFGDDVIDIALTAIVSNLRVSPPIIRYASDNVPTNDMAFNKVFPYAPTPQNGRNHFHSQ